MNQEALTIQNVPFLSDEIPASIDNDNIIWSVVSMICNNLGLTEDQKKRQVKNIQEDLVLSSGCKKLRVKYDTQVREALCIQNNYLPLWLAKISITPNMKSEHPEVVDKLIQYQLTAKDVLAEYFLGKKNPPVTADPRLPLSREELAAYMLYTERHTDVIENMMSSFIENQTKSAAEFMEIQRQNSQNFFTTVTTILSEFTDAVKLMIKTPSVGTALNTEIVKDSTNSVKDILSEKTDTQWMENAFISVKMIANKTGEDWRHVLRKIYKKVKNEYGLDLTFERDLFMKENNIETMRVIQYVSTDSDLMSKFEHCTKEMWNGVKNMKNEISHSSASNVTTSPELLTADKPDSAEAGKSAEPKNPTSKDLITIPAEIRETVRPLCDMYGKTIQRVMQLVYRDIEEIAGVSLGQMATECAERYHYSIASKAYIVGNDDNLMRIFREVVDSMMKRGIE